MGKLSTPTTLLIIINQLETNCYVSMRRDMNSGWFFYYTKHFQKLATENIKIYENHNCAKPWYIFDMSETKSKPNPCQ